MFYEMAKSSATTSTGMRRIGVESAGFRGTGHDLRTPDALPEKRLNTIAFTPTLNPKEAMVI